MADAGTKQHKVAATAVVDSDADSLEARLAKLAAM
jgi:hypothetical protein